MNSVTWVTQRHRPRWSLDSIQTSWHSVGWPFSHTFLPSFWIKGGTAKMVLFILNHFCFLLARRKNDKQCSVQSIPDVSKVPRTHFSIRSVSTGMHVPHKFCSSIPRFGSDPQEQWLLSFHWWHFLLILCTFPKPEEHSIEFWDHIINNLKYTGKPWGRRGRTLGGKCVMLGRKAKNISLPLFLCPSV